MKTFRSIEFRDSDGDLVIKHGFMNDTEAQKLMDLLIESGMTETIIFDLTPMSVKDAADVKSFDELAESFGCGIVRRS